MTFDIEADLNCLKWNLRTITLEYHGARISLMNNPSVNTGDQLGELSYSILLVHVEVTHRNYCSSMCSGHSVVVKSVRFSVSMSRDEPDLASSPVGVSITQP